MKLLLSAFPILVNLYGKGLVDVYLLEESQNWSGCLISTNAIKHLDESCDGSEDADSKQFEAKQFIVKHNLQLKKDKKKTEFHVVNWIRYFNTEFGQKEIRESFAKFNKQITPRVQSIIDNTIEFYLKMKNGG